MRIVSKFALILLLAVGLVIWFLLPWWALLALLGVLGILLGASRQGRRTLAILRLGLTTLSQRIGASLVILIGIAGVVGVLVALLAMSEGLTRVLHSTGSPDTAIVLRAGATSELASGLTRSDVTLIRQKPGIAHNVKGQPLASPELVVIVNLPKKSSGTTANVQLRGVGHVAWAVRPEIHIVKGRKFRPGFRELDVGVGAEQQFAGLGLGDTVQLGSQPWKVVGIFKAGDAHDSELWADADTVASAFSRGGYQSVTVRLRSPGTLPAFRAALTSDPQLKVQVQTTKKYYAAQSGRLTKTIRIVGFTVALIMAIGAVFGALNTMYAAVSDRAREIATLRALGFGGLPVATAVLLEAMVLAALGGLLGGGIAWLLFNGYTVSTLGSNFSQLVFQFRVTPQLLFSGLKWALAIGLVGGLFPALRAARVPVTVALREL